MTEGTPQPKQGTTTVIRSSRARVAARSLPDLALGAAFPLLYVLAIAPADHLPSWFKTIFALAALVSLPILLRALFRITRVLRTPADWRVTITNDRLLWETAIPAPGFPLDIALSEIAEAYRLDTFTLGSEDDTTITSTYALRTKDRRDIGLTQDQGGINPHCVFKALAARGIPYRTYECDQREDPDNTRRVRVSP